MEAIITKSPSEIKKYKVIVNDGNNKKTIHFGAKGYDDYTIHKDNMRKNNYIKRHKKNEDWENPFTAGFWALHILWNKRTIESSLNDIKRNFNIKITNNI